jgi:hypothetical protein
VHDANDRFEYRGVRRWQDAVSQVKDMARLGTGLREYFTRRFNGELFTAETPGGIEVSLDGFATDAPTALVEIHVPVNAHDRAARTTHEAQELTRADSKENRRHVEVSDAIDNPLGRG